MLQSWIVIPTRINIVIPRTSLTKLVATDRERDLASPVESKWNGVVQVYKTRDKGTRYVSK